MTRTQRRVWVSAVGLLAGVALTIKGLAGALASKSMPISPLWMILWLLFLNVAIVLAIRKKRPEEVDSDERDELIKARAMKVAFGSGCILLWAAIIFLAQTVGMDGSCPVRVFSWITMTVLFMAMFVYFVAILIQYGWGGKDG